MIDLALKLADLWSKVEVPKRTQYFVCVGSQELQKQYRGSVTSWNLTLYLTYKLSIIEQQGIVNKCQHRLTIQKQCGIFVSMRKIITTTFITLDGVLQAPGGSEEDTADGFKYGGWQIHWDDGDGTADEIMDTKILSAPFDLLLGRITYDIWAGFWPLHKDEPRWGKPFDRATKYVVAHKPFKLSWDKSELITGDVVVELKKLKHSNGPDLLVWGSGNLIQTLLKHNLIDRMHIWTYPITIGTGKKLFGDGTLPEVFKQTYAKITPRGVVFATYEPSEPLKRG